MKRSLSFGDLRAAGLVAAGTGVIAATYGLVRLAYGLFLPDVEGELSFGAAVAGLISAGASVLYCLGAIIGFFLAARHPTIVVFAAALTASLGAAGMAAAQQAAPFAAFVLLGSTGAGLASPGLVSIVRRNVAAGAEDRSQAVVNAGAGPGLVAAGVLAFLLLPDWRTAWLIVAGCTISVGTAVLLLDRGVRQAAAPDAAGVTAVPSFSWFRAHRHVIMAAFLLGAGSAAVWNDGRTRLVAAGATDETSVAAWIALGLGGTLVIATARLLSGRHPRTRWTITALPVAAASATIALAPNATAAALAACAAFGWGYTAGTGALIAWTARIDADRAPAGTALLFVTLVLGQAVGAAATGVLITAAGFAIAFLAAAAITCAAAVTPLLASQPDRRG